MALASCHVAPVAMLLLLAASFAVSHSPLSPGDSALAKQISDSQIMADDICMEVHPSAFLKISRDLEKIRKEYKSNKSRSKRASKHLKPAMMGRLQADISKYVTAFATISPSGAPNSPQLPRPEKPGAPGIIDTSAKQVESLFNGAATNRAKWGYGYCVCEVCHTVIETLQLKMFMDYGLGFQDQDVYDVIEDSFCDTFLPYYRSGCQYILSYKYSSITPLLIFMAPYDICMFERMCFGTTHKKSTSFMI